MEGTPLKLLILLTDTPLPGLSLRRGTPLCLLLALLLLAQSGCAWFQGRKLAQELASRGGLESVAYEANGFVMRGFIRLDDSDYPTDELVVYIEGDGHAYVDKRTPSNDPTPQNPMSLRLALEDPAPSLLYLGRPCQFAQDDEGCSSRYWTVGRYAPVTVDAMNKALDQAKAQAGARKLYLAGYSGGGAMAALLAARRSDVAGLATVAGNLDHALWTRIHCVSPLRGSLNPVDDAERLRQLPQAHFSGGHDEIVPTLVTESFMKKIGEDSLARMVVIEQADHACCWPRLWPKLLREWGALWGR